MKRLEIRASAMRFVLLGVALGWIFCSTVKGEGELDGNASPGIRNTPEEQRNNATAAGYMLWTTDSVPNNLPQITSTPPALVNRTYRYDVEAFDSDGDPLTFSLSNAPAGMTIDAFTGQIEWTVPLDLVGTFSLSVSVVDSKGGVSAAQTITLTVKAEIFTQMTVGFLEGIDLQDGATEQDSTVLSLGGGADMSEVTDIVLPNVEKLFTFSAPVSFYMEYRNGKAIVVSEQSVARVAVEDTATGGKAFEAILPTNLNQMTWTATVEIAATETKSIVFECRDGKYFKIGHFTLNLTQGTVTFAYADVTP